MNYYHTPFLIDLIHYSSLQVPDFDVPVPKQFVVPEMREHLYVPGSASCHPSLFGKHVCVSAVAVVAALLHISPADT